MAVRAPRMNTKSLNVLHLKVLVVYKLFSKTWSILLDTCAVVNVRRPKLSQGRSASARVDPPLLQGRSATGDLRAIHNAIPNFQKLTRFSTKRHFSTCQKIISTTKIHPKVGRVSAPRGWRTHPGGGPSPGCSIWRLDTSRQISHLRWRESGCLRSLRRGNSQKMWAFHVQLRNFEPAIFHLNIYAIRV